MVAKSPNALLLILGNQLFPLDQVLALESAAVFMAEDQYLCSHFRYHQQKIVLVLAAMRAELEAFAESVVRSQGRAENNCAANFGTQPPP